MWKWSHILFRQMPFKYLGYKSACYLFLHFGVCIECQKLGGYGGVVVVDCVVEGGVLISIDGVGVGTIFQKDLHAVLMLALCGLRGLSRGKRLSVQEIRDNPSTDFTKWLHLNARNLYFNLSFIV